VGLPSFASIRAQQAYPTSHSPTYTCNLYYSLCEKKQFFSILSFRRVNYIFYKLYINTKHAQFWLRMSSWRIFVWKQVLSSFFMCFLRSSYIQPCGWNCPRVEGQGSQKIVFFAHKILGFHFFFTFFVLMVLYDVTFNVTTMIWMWKFPFCLAGTTNFDGLLCKISIRMW